jgi:hypothetical protein
LKIPVKKIDETQKALLYQSILNSKPVRPKFLQEYDLELNKTVAYLRERDKITIYKDEMKNGFEHFTAKINADLKEEEIEERQEKNKFLRKFGITVAGLFGGLAAGAIAIAAAPMAIIPAVVTTVGGQVIGFVSSKIIEYVFS